MARKTGLGRGLSALIPGADANISIGGISYIPVEQIHPNPHQPRFSININELEELASSIKEHGILQPVVVSYDQTNEQYILIAGERRLQAARLAALELIPAIIREVSEAQRLQLALVENLQRADLNPLEEAEAYRQLHEDFNLNHEEIASKVGRSRTAVSNTLRLLKLPASIRKALAENEISEGHARALLALPTPQAQSAVLQSIQKKGLNVRQTEELVRHLTSARPLQTSKLPTNPELTSLEDRLRQRYGTKVTLQARQKGGGTIIIHYYSQEELNSLIDELLGNYE